MRGRLLAVCALALVVASCSRDAGESICHRLASLGREDFTVRDVNFIASVREQGPDNIEFAGCEQIIPFETVHSNAFFEARRKAIMKRNVIYVAGVTSGTLVYMRSVKIMTFRELSTTGIHETVMPPVL